MKMFIRNRVGGIIYSTPYNDALKQMVETTRKNGIPTVNCYGSTRINASDVITADATMGCYKAMKYLLELGHRHIAILKVRGSGISKRRLEGCKKAFTEFGLEMNPDLIVEADDFTQRSGFRSAKLLFNQPNIPSALFAFSEQLAMGVLKAAKSEGIAIPRDMSLIGVDDMIADLLDPPLTSLSIPTYEVGHAAASLLFDRIEKRKNDSPPRCMLMDETLTVRDSTGSLRTAISL